MPYSDVSWKTIHDGYLPVLDEDLIKVIEKTKKVAWEVSALTNGIIVPAWVFESIKHYNDIGGYAGLALYEYLDKMSEERQPQPLHTF